MKYVVEFGVRGGAHKDNLIVPTRELAENMARSLVMVFCNDPHASGATARDWLFYKGCARMTWQSETHFVAVSKLDGVPRGTASAGLWRKLSGPELLYGQVIDSRDASHLGAA
jgi:hypothetical protein